MRPSARWTPALLGLVALAAGAAERGDLLEQGAGDVFLRLYAWQAAPGHVLVPLRGIAGWLGAETAYDAETRQVTVVGDGVTVRLPLDRDHATVERGGVQQEVTVEPPAQVRGDATLAPLRFVAEALGCAVRWVPRGDVEAIDFSPVAVVELRSGERQGRLAVQPIPPHEVEQVRAAAQWAWDLAESDQELFLVYDPFMDHVACQSFLPRDGVWQRLWETPGYACRSDGHWLAADFFIGTAPWDSLIEEWKRAYGKALIEHYFGP